MQDYIARANAQVRKATAEATLNDHLKGLGNDVDVNEHGWRFAFCPNCGSESVFEWGEEEYQGDCQNVKHCRSCELTFGIVPWLDAIRGQKVNG